MPVYNASHYLKEAIESILHQTYHDFEFIIINDGSTDRSLEIINGFSDSRIRVINNDKNLGIIRSRNIGLEVARGRYIANMDADDISLPDRLEKQLAYMEAHPETVVLASRLVLINDKDEETGIWPEDYNCITSAEIKRVLPLVNCVGQPTIIMRSDVVKKIGYNKEFTANEDWGLWLHLLSEGYVIAKLPDTLLRYRQHDASTTAKANATGVDKKIAAFKFKYLKYKLFKNKFRGADKHVLSSLIKDIIRLFFKTISPRFYLFLKSFAKLEGRKFIHQYKTANQTFKKIGQPAEIIYFFPYVHVGGAERVHASIMEAVSSKNAIAFITGQSANNAFLDKFSAYSTVIQVDQLLGLGFSERWLTKKIITKCIGKNTKAFGCNSYYFYNLIPALPKSVQVTDLLHAFVHRFEDGPEKWSLPLVSRINHRVVINNKTKLDFKELYQKNNIPKEFLQRIQLIQNFTENQKQNLKRELKPFKVAYVGRGGDEKRIYLIAQTAKNISGKTKGVEFHFVGNTANAIPDEFSKYCIIHNEINNETELQNLYSQFHVLIIASSREGFPMVIMEAMMHGLVPLSTDVGGIAEHLVNNENGYLITSISEEKIIKDFEQRIMFLYQNPDEWIRLSKNAYMYALQHFSKQAFFNSWAELLGHQKT